jgi:asparagine synthase (glutamine-hydrolysing)
MCGIVGIGGALEARVIGAALEKMNRAILHRGPDDEGIWTQEGFGFGMRRLSIIDLVTGHQPMWNPDSGTGIVFNGEIYNYKDLRGDLEKQGFHFSTTSDTEVALKSLAKRGLSAVSSWNGMFAAAVWDTRKNSLLLVRDRLGVKPLYYYWDGNLFLFASEIKAILRSGLIQPRLEDQAIWDYLTFRYVPGPGTIWKNIWKLPPAHALSWSPGRDPELSRYWRTDVISDPASFSWKTKLREFEALFLDAVKIRLLASDVPVGVLLSGGLDSSAVAAAAVELGHKHFQAFSVGFRDGGEFSELPFARMMADHVGAEFHDVIVDRKSFLEILPEAIRAADEPLADLSIVPLLALARLTNQHVKVVLSGEGSDEILAGYDFNKAVVRWDFIRRLQRIPKPMLKALLWPISRFSKSLALYANHILNTPLSRWNSAFQVHMTNYFGQQEKSEFQPGVEGLDSRRIIDELYREARSNDPLDQMLSVYQKSWLVEDLLMKADKITMSASLELRVPFLDYRLVEWANRQPRAVKIAHGGLTPHSTKAILRRFAEARLPRKILMRPKRGFPVPVYQWLQEDDFSAWVSDRLTGKTSALLPRFSSDAMRALLAKSRRGDGRSAHKIWLLLVLEIWLHEYREYLDAS